MNCMVRYNKFINSKPHRKFETTMFLKYSHYYRNMCIDEERKVIYANNHP